MHPVPIRPFIGRGLLFAFALMTMGVAFAQAAILRDFERAYWVEDDSLQCKDHALVKDEGVYHLFYIHSFPPNGSDYLRAEKWLGHLTSTDLVHWTRQDSILPVSEAAPGGWEDSFIWAPKVIQDPGSGDWRLYYTGVNSTVTQQAGLAFSTDLFDWVRWPLNPVYHPGSWAQWAAGSWSNCRDPELFQDPGTGTWHMFNTATMADGRGAISHASSANLSFWSDQGAFFENDSEAVLESVQLIESSGLYHMFFTEQWVQGTSHISSPTFEGPWTKDDLTIIDSGNAPEVSDLGDEIVFSRHDAISTPGEPLFYYRFDRIDLDGPGGVPAILPTEQGLGPDWTVVFGSAFDNQPTWGDNPYFRGEASSNMEGNGYLATFEDFNAPVSGEQGGSQGRLPVGLLRGEPFTLSETRLSLLVGGGEDLGREFVGLVRAQDETLLFMETGSGGHSMNLKIWDIHELVGEEVFLVVADLSFNADGWISTDSIREYIETGVDSVIPALPMLPGPRLDDVLAEAGFDLTSSPGNAPGPLAAGRLLAPHPNPFNPRSHLRYELERGGRVELTVHDANGRLQRRLFEGELGAGPGFFVWDGRDDAGRALPSGLYLARLSLDGQPLDRKKLNLIR